MASQAIRTNFIHLPLGLFLRVSFTYLLTKDNGKTPRGGTHIGPILSHWLNQERNGQILRSLRFWSLVLTHGNKQQLAIPTGHERIVVDLSSASGNMAFGINGDTIDCDRLASISTVVEIKGFIGLAILGWRGPLALQRSKSKHMRLAQAGFL